MHLLHRRLTDTVMPLHPDAKPILGDYNRRFGSQPRTAESIPALRAALAADPRPQCPSVDKCQDLRIPGPASEIPLRLYAPQGKAPHPVLVTFHGGGWVLGSIDSHDAIARRLANAGGCAVVSVGYRLAPETKSPGALEDCYAAVQWVALNARSLGLDGARLAVGGESSGGNLAAAIALMGRERRGPPIVFQLLIYPALDCDFETGSYRLNAMGCLLTRDTMMANWRLYLRTEADARDLHAASLQASDLRGLPPALVITAEYDPLRDEGEAYVSRLLAAGVDAKGVRYEGVPHAFFSYPDRFQAANDALEQAAGALQQAFSTPSEAKASRAR